MPTEKIRTCAIAGCGKNTTHFRHHCIGVHGMTNYMYGFFLLLVQSWKREMSFNFNDQYVCFFDDMDNTLLLKVRLPADRNKRRSKTTGSYRGSTSSEETSETTTPPPNVPATPPTTVPVTPLTVPVIRPTVPITSLTPRKILFPPSPVAGRLQPAASTAVLYRGSTSSEEISETTTPPPIVPVTPPTVPITSLTPQKIRYPPSSVAARLQEAGLYDPAPESLPEIYGFRKSLHMAEGETLTAKTTQLYYNARKLYSYLRSNNPLETFPKRTSRRRSKR